MIPVDYPSSKPVFSLELNWHGKHTRENSENVRVSNPNQLEANALNHQLFLINYRKWKLK